jgi:hypothetical protein
MHNAIEHSQLELIPVAGHLPNLERSELFEWRLWQFLNKL